MNIFVKIKNSIYNPEYYSEVIEKPFSYSFKYLLVFALLFALVFTIVVTIRFIPTVNLLSEKALQIADYFPQDLAITIKDGKVSTNVQEPYLVKIPQEWKSSNGADSEYADMENIIAIDTRGKFDMDTFNSYKTFILLTSDSIAYIEQGKISITSLSGVKDFTLNKGKVSSLVSIVKPFFVFLYPVVFAGAYIAGYLIVLWKMAYLLFGALLIWLVAKVKGLQIGYKNSYKVGMQLATAAIIVTGVLDVISTKLTFTFLFSILLIISAALNLKKGAAQSSVSTPVA